MYKVYLKQAWQMLKEDKVISIITILGTALAITMVMAIILTQRIKTTNMGPEVNRERTMYIQYVKEETKKQQYVSIGSVSINSYKQYLEQLTVPEKISMISERQINICTEGSDIYHTADIKYTDAAFWSIYSFSFISGKPFTNEEFQSGVPVAVISKSLSNKLYNEESDATGKIVLIDKKPYKVIGIVKDVSTLCKYAYSQIWIPYTSNSFSNTVQSNIYKAVVLAKNTSDFPEIKSEVRRSEIANNPEREDKEVSFIGPFSGDEILVKTGNMNNDDPDMAKNRLRYYLTLAVLLLIPAINLSGFSLFKIINRTSEIGIRKAFGANKKTILMQVLYENFLTSLIGGIIGLALSFLAINFIKDKLFTQGPWSPQLIGENTIPVSAFISPGVFLYVFLVCVLLNLLSSGIPAWRASRLNIVEAIRS